MGSEEVPKTKKFKEKYEQAKWEVLDEEGREGLSSPVGFGHFLEPLSFVWKMAKLI